MSWLETLSDELLARGIAERSLIEGVERGGIEGLAAAAGFALLGGAIGVAMTAPEAEERASDLPGGCAPRRDS